MKSGLISVEDALARVLACAREPMPPETVSIADALDRTLAADLSALRTQPPFAASAMDGYAVQAADVTAAGARLTVTGQAAAGHGYPGTVGTGEAVRILTGAPVPAGADTILIQENAERIDDAVIVREPVRAGAFVRRPGLDFAEGDVLLRAGDRLGPRSLALAAALGHPTVPVRRRPLVALLATGDELVRPGERAGPDQIVASSIYAVAGIAARAGASTLDLGIAGDSFTALEEAISLAAVSRADVLVTLGGASVGDHDLVQSALMRRGMTPGFWRIAMRPGKPLIFGQLQRMAILGLPGNPVSSIICATLFLAPLLRALMGDPNAAADPTQPALLGVDLPANDQRQDYIRARLDHSTDGLPRAFPLPVQDSSMLSALVAADALLVRPPGAPASITGSPCRIIPLTV